MAGYLRRFQRLLHILLAISVVLLLSAFVATIFAAQQAPKLILRPGILPWMIDVVVVLGLVEIAAFSMPPRRKRWLSALLLVLLTLGGGLFVDLFAWYYSPLHVSKVSLPDGRQIMLAEDLVWTDTVFSLWQPHDSYWSIWQEVEAYHLTYSENGDFTWDAKLVVAPEGDRLLVRRGGIWTDCFDVVDEIRNCEGTKTYLDWQNPDEWFAQSERIERLTNLSPGPMENRQPLN